MQENEGLSIEELAERVGVPVRTIRFYIAEDLLEGPGMRGKAATYGDEHLLRLRLIRRLSEQRVPLAEIRALLSRLSIDEVRALLSEEEQRAELLEHTAQVSSPKDYISALLNHARQARQPIATEKPPGVVTPSSPMPTTDVHQRQFAEEVWHRWELAPGLELSVRASTQEQYRTLIERLLKVASEMRNRSHK